MKKVLTKLILAISVIAIFIGIFRAYKPKDVSLKYLDGVKAVNNSLISFEKMRHEMLSGKVRGKEYYFDSLRLVSAYMATGNEEYIEIAKEGAEYIRTNISSIGLVEGHREDKEISTAVDQSSILFMVSYIASFDNSYIELIERLADGIINNYINPENNLVWDKVNSKTGVPLYSDKYEYESQLGNSSLKCAQALLIAYKYLPEKTNYKNKAMDIIYSVWERRNTKKSAYNMRIMY